MIALEKDLIIFPKLAHEKGIYLHNIDDDEKFSFHKAVSLGSKQIIKLFGEMFGSSTMSRLGLTADNHGLTALDYARKSDDQEILELV